MLDSQTLSNAMYNYGREKALELRADAPNLTDTEIIDQELFVPTWREGYQPLNAIIKYEEQVYRVIQEHDSTGNPSWNPVDTPALFSVCHTKNPNKAKPWVQPFGTSGMYYLDECYVDTDNRIWRQIYDGENIYDVNAVPSRWEQVTSLPYQPPHDEELVGNEQNGSNENIEPDNPSTNESGESTDDGGENNEYNNNEGGESGENGDEPIIDNPSENEYDEWKQPTGAHDAYDVGAIVSYNDKIWINTSPANIYAPGVFGWNEVVE